MRDWIQSTVAEHTEVARPVASLTLPRVGAFFPRSLLEETSVVVAEHIPKPPLAELGWAGLTDFDAIEGVAITYDNTYFIRPSVADDASVHFHELVHVIQYAELGIDGFLLAYGLGLLQHGYHDCPLELMVRGHQARFERGDAPYGVAGRVRSELAAMGLNA